MSKSITIKNHFANLATHQFRLQNTGVEAMFDADPQRFEKMSAACDGLHLDYSRNRIDAGALDALLAFAADMGVEARRDAMFRGDIINQTENRRVLHTALRRPPDQPLFVDGQDVMKSVGDVFERMETFAKQVRNHEYCPSGKPITNVVNIGIGGSDLGPRMAVEALAPFHDGPHTHFVANVDGADLSDTIGGLDPHTTLFIVASKTFTTQETMANARAAHAWLKSSVGETATGHFVALSTNLAATLEFGIPEARIFGFWDWVGGRYSVWSAIGLSLMIAVGPADFRRFLDGGNVADIHFAQTPLGQNLPVLLALIGIWHRNICECSSLAILPYDNRLSGFPRWMQQLDMESNGKSVMMNGDPVEWKTGPVIFGEPGTNGQHAFYQLLHQGSEVIPCDFLIAAKGHESEMDDQHQLLVANCIAQAQALMCGRSIDAAQGNPHRVFSGNRPSNVLLYAQLDPHMLGLLMAIYEHKIFVQGILWGINSFDQWGVELGKELAGNVISAIAKDPLALKTDAATGGLLARYHALRKCPVQDTFS